MKIESFRRFWKICVLIGAVVATACTPSAPPTSQQADGSGAAAVTPTPAPEHTPAATPASAANGTTPPTGTTDSQQAPSWPDITLVETYSGLRNPVDLAHAGDGSGRLYVVEQIGLVQEFARWRHGPVPVHGYPRSGELLR